MKIAFVVLAVLTAPMGKAQPALVDEPPPCVLETQLNPAYPLRVHILGVNWRNNG